MRSACCRSSPTPTSSGRQDVWPWAGALVGAGAASVSLWQFYGEGSNGTLMACFLCFGASFCLGTLGYA